MSDEELITYFICETHNQGAWQIDDIGSSATKILDFHKNQGCKIKYLTKQQYDELIAPKPDSLQQCVDSVISAACKAEERKSEFISLSQKDYQQKIHDEVHSLKETINSHFPGKFPIIEACLAVKAQQKIEGITQVFTLILIGQPSSYKSTMLEIVSALPSCYVSDSFTPKSFVSHSANTSKEKLSKVDLLPRIKHKTLITPELAPLFSGNPDQLVEYFGILTRVLDGRGYLSDSGVHGQRGYVGDYSFMWIGAAVDIPYRVWKVLGNLGPKIYFLRVPSDERLDTDKKEAIKHSIRENDYNSKVKECKKAIRRYWNFIENRLEDDKIKWNKEQDDNETFDRIIDLAQLLAKLRASVPTWHTSEADSSGSNYNYEMPVIEDPNRASNALYNLARGHAVLFGRNYIAKEDLGVVIFVTLSSASRERVELFKLLLENNGKLSSSKFMEVAHVSRPTALKEMQLLNVIGLVDKDDEDAETKPVTIIRLKSEYRWFLSDEFRHYWSEFTTSLTPNFSLLSLKNKESKEKRGVSKGDGLTKFFTKPENNNGESEGIV